MKITISVEATTDTEITKVADVMAQLGGKPARKPARKPEPEPETDPVIDDEGEEPAKAPAKKAAKKAAKKPSKTAASGTTINDVRKAMQQFVKAGRKDDMMGILAEFGASKLSELEEGDYESFAARLTGEL